MTEAKSTMHQETEKEEPLLLRAGEWFSPFQKPENLPRIKRDVEIPFALETYGPGKISVFRDLNFTLENLDTKNSSLLNVGEKPLTLTFKGGVSGSGKHFWRLTGERAPMVLVVKLENIPKDLLESRVDKYKRPYKTTGLRCLMEIPLRNKQKEIFFIGPTAASGLSIDDQEVQNGEFFGGLWKQKNMPWDFKIYFPDNDPELFKQVRIKFEKHK